MREADRHMDTAACAREATGAQRKIRAAKLGALMVPGERGPQRGGREAEEGGKEKRKGGRERGRREGREGEGMEGEGGRANDSAVRGRRGGGRREGGELADYPSSTPLFSSLEVFEAQPRPQPLRLSDIPIAAPA